jgi:hypothetical protein
MRNCDRPNIEVSLNIQQVQMERLHAQINVLNWEMHELKKEFQTFRDDIYKLIIDKILK